MVQKCWAFVAGAALLLLQSAGMAAVNAPPNQMSKETKACIKCHTRRSPGIVEEWKKGRHAQKFVGCYECHKAEPGDPDAFPHQTKKKALRHTQISIIVSPKDCANCHEKEVKEFTDSHHAAAGRILGSMDNLLAEVVEGNLDLVTEGNPEGESAAVVNGCWQCHGTVVKVLEDPDTGKPTGALDPATWPNTGMGRFNPDGSIGSCTACHSRHRFSRAVARLPETCGKCHMGPDHPQREIYKESKHGIAFRALHDEMNMDARKWVVGKHYSAAPTCATCHMSATREQEVTHDVGLRISWTNRPAISIRPEITDAKLGLPGADIKWDTRRENMKDVCTACHSETFVDNFYVQYDGLIELYNNKFGHPGMALKMAAGPLLKPIKFSNELDFIWFEIWHHEGRRARHGASMMGPDWTHWHGTYEVGKHFYAKYIPKLQKLAKENLKSEDPKKQEAAKKLAALIDEVLNDKFVIKDKDGNPVMVTDQDGNEVELVSRGHKWYIDKMDAEEQAARAEEIRKFNERYGSAAKETSTGLGGGK